MKKLYTLCFAFLVAISIPTISTAAEETEMNAWADCGIGAMLFKKNETAAIISNLIWDLGTTALTSMVSSKGACQGQDAVAALFIYRAYTNLEEDTVRGNGKHVTAVLGILGCESASHGNLINAVRSDFVGIVSDPAYTEKTTLTKAKEYYNIVQSNIAGKCSSA